MNDSVELIDIVDENNNIIRSAERDYVHEENLIHRSVHIFVFNSAGYLFVQKRAATKKEFPGKYDSSAAGHLDSGESYDAAARRELMEELSIDVPVRKMMELDACRATGNEFVHFYTAGCDNEIKIDRNEIEEGRFWSIESLKGAVKTEETSFTPAFVMLFEEYSQRNNL